jgi:hypothetical protein
LFHSLRLLSGVSDGFDIRLATDYRSALTLESETLIRQLRDLNFAVADQLQSLLD